MWCGGRLTVAAGGSAARHAACCRQRWLALFMRSRCGQLTTHPTCACFRRWVQSRWASSAEKSSRCVCEDLGRARGHGPLARLQGKGGERACSAAARRRSQHPPTHPSETSLAPPPHTQWGAGRDGRHCCMMPSLCLLHPSNLQLPPPPPHTHTGRPQRAGRDGDGGAAQGAAGAGWGGAPPPRLRVLPRLRVPLLLDGGSRGRVGVCGCVCVGVWVGGGAGGESACAAGVRSWQGLGRPV